MGKEIRQPPVEISPALLHMVRFHLETPDSVQDSLDEGHDYCAYTKQRGSLYDSIKPDPSRPEIVQRNNALARIALDFGVLLNSRLYNRQDIDSEYFFHFFQVAGIMIDILQIKDPYLILLCFLHDVNPTAFDISQAEYTVCLELNKLKQNHPNEDAYDSFHELISTKINDKSLSNDLQRIAQAKKVTREQTDQLEEQLDKQGLIDTIISGDLTFQQYADLIQQAREIMRGQGGYLDLLTLVEELEAITNGDNADLNVDCLAVLMAHEIDRNSSPVSCEGEDLVRKRVVSALETQLFILMLAHFFGMEKAVQVIARVNCQVLFPRQWQALNEGIALAESRTPRKRSIARLHKVNVFKLRKSVENYLQQEGLADQAIYVDKDIYAARKVQKIAGQREGPLLAANEWTIVANIKDPSSILAKLIKVAVKSNLFDYDSPIEEVAADPEFWAKFLLEESRDWSRATVILGEELASRFFGATTVKKENPIDIDQESFLGRLEREMHLFDHGSHILRKPHFVNYALACLSDLVARCEEVFEIKKWAEGKAADDLHLILKTAEDGGEVESVPNMEVQIQSAKRNEKSNIGQEALTKKEISSLIHAVYKIIHTIEGCSDIEVAQATQVVSGLMKQLAYLIYDGALS